MQSKQQFLRRFYKIFSYFYMKNFWNNIGNTVPLQLFLVENIEFFVIIMTCKDKRDEQRVLLKNGDNSKG